MDNSHNDSLLSEAEELEALAIIGSYRSARKAHEAGLAVLACGHHYWVKFVEERYLLVVPREFAVKLKKEVDTTALRNRYWPPRSLDLSLRSLSKLPTSVFVGFLVFVYWAQVRLPHLKEIGVNSSEAVVERGEWWRIVTAITLHADIGHLAGNLLGVTIFSYLCCRYMGNGLAWFLILVAASLANLSNALLNAGEAYSSLGASTAVFAALGLLTGFPIGAYFRLREPIQSRDWLIPFFGGCVLFAWMGGGEFPTDVPGHFMSFAYGLVMAIVVAWASFHAKLGMRYQFALLFFAAFIVAASWALAWS